MSGTGERVATETLTKDGFAALVLDVLRHRQPDVAWRYHKDEFELRTPDGRRTASLQRAYQAYCHPEVGSWRQLLSDMLDMLTSDVGDFGPPRDFLDATAGLFPQIFSRAEVTRFGRDAQDQNAHLALCEHLVVGLVHRTSPCAVHVTAKMVSDWGVTVEEAMESAVRNFRRDLCRPPVRIGKATYAWQYVDDYNACHLLADDRIRACKLKGDPIVMARGRQSVIITGSDDLEGLSEMVATARARTHRTISCIPVRRVGDAWVGWMPDRGHPLRADFERLRALETRYWYAQRSMEAAELDLKVPPVGLGSPKSGGTVTGCNWMMHPDFLLPRADYLSAIAYDTQRDVGLVVAGNVPWDKASPVILPAMEPVDAYPPLWKMTRQLTKEEAERLRSMEGTGAFPIPQDADRVLSPVQQANDAQQTGHTGGGASP